MTELEKLRAEVRRLNECLREKNLELDAMHYVWCTGGCPDGAHRWTEDTLTEEVVARAERNVKRLRLRLTNRAHRLSLNGDSTRG